MEKYTNELGCHHYSELLGTEDVDLVPNSEPFDCTICLSTIPPTTGITIRDCLHQFCCECLAGHVTHAEGPEVQCPYVQDYKCEQHLQEREVRALTSGKQLEALLEKSLQQVELQSKNSFHCLTANCKGWCFYENLVNHFDCPLCHKSNCLNCKVLHEGMNCRQYQDDLKQRASHDVHATKTQEAIEVMLEQKTAMKCPGCGIIVQKNGGCDQMKCSVCQQAYVWGTVN